MAILEVSNLKKIYTTRFGGNQVQALKNINFSVEEGEYVAIGACVYYKDCALRVDSMKQGIVTRVEVIKNL